MFTVDDIVWAKSSLAREIFWPAKVIEPDSDLDDQLKKKVKKPTIAYVNYLAENTFDAIKKASNVKPFDCESKEAFVMKGRRLKKQGKRLLFESAVREAETFMKLHGKSMPKVSSRKVKRSALPTIAEEMNTKDSSNIKQIKTAQNKSSIVTRRSRTQLKNIKPKIEKTNLHQKELHVESGGHLGRIQSKNRRNKSDKSNLNKFKETGESKSLDRPCTRRNNASKVVEPEITGNSSQETKLNIKRKKKTYQESASTENTFCKVSNRQRACSESEVGSLKRTKRGKCSGNKSDNDNSVGVKDVGDIRIDKLETIVEECEDGSDEMILKRVRSGEETDEAFENGDEELWKETKRPRMAMSKKEMQKINTDICEGDFMEPLFDGSKTQNACNAFDIHDNLLYRDKDIEAAQNSVHTKPCLESVDNCLSGLNSSSCGNSSRCSEFGGVHAMDNTSDSRVASETADELFGCNVNDNEKRLENLGAREESEEDDDSDNEENETGDDSSDDDSLPEAFSPSPATKNFQRGDVVWAKHMKFPPWPAQVGKPPTKKLKTHYNIIFLPKSSDKGIMILKKNVQSFSQDRETFLRFKNQEIQPHLMEDFNRAVEQAEEILLRRVFQKDDIPMDDILEGEASDSSDDDDVSNLEQAKPVDPGRKPVSESEEPVEKSQEDESGFDSSEMDTEDDVGSRKKHVGRYGNVLNELHQCKQRLLGVYRGEVPSFRHRIFKCGRVSQRNSLKHKGGFGPIQDEETREEIVRLLKMWYDAETKQSSLTLNYVLEVWLPEAMIYYIQLKDNISAEQAEEMYLDHARNVDKRDVKEASNLLKMKRIDEETMMRTVDIAKQKLLYGGL